ncbi:MAG: cytochrome c [Flavobacteriales bacterium]|nr:cytochrome c [Flavobacteriales bacterium]
MRTKTIVPLATLVALFAFTACGGGGDDKPSGPPGASGSAPAADAGKSKAKMFTAADITLGDIDLGMVDKGQNIYDVKCQACHSLGKNRVVGPGFKGIMENRRPEWVMNMILNIDVMLETDEEAQRLLEECLVRMPNQGLSKDEGRNVLEFLRTL